MTVVQTAEALASGKGHRDENFPVASFLVRKQHRPVILSFYRFARAADDVADHAEASPSSKLQLLDEMRCTLVGERNSAPEALALRRSLLEKDLSAQHALDLLTAFERDVTKPRYADWDELMDYCSYSAMPVGRFVLDVHGESHLVWPASDALCAALQVINHLQDCSLDYRNLGRVYIPLDLLGRHGLTPAVLAERKAPPQLRQVIVELIGCVSSLLAESRPFAGQIADHRLALEVSVIQRLAEDLARRLLVRDPLSERVRHKGWEAAGISAMSALAFLTRRRATGSQSAASRGLHGSLHGS